MTDAAAHLRRHRQGLLLADGHPNAVRFVIDGPTGRLVFPSEGFIADAEELVLFVPTENPVGDSELQLLLSAGEATQAAADRWQAYHGQPPSRLFASFGIEGTKLDGTVVEEPVTTTNPLTPSEGRLCRSINSDRPRLVAACRRLAGVDIGEPMAVGVDQFGIDVRARFGIVRLEFDAPASTTAEAEAAVLRLLGGGA